MIISVKIESIAFAVSKSKGALQRTIAQRRDFICGKGFKYASFRVEALATAGYGVFKDGTSWIGTVKSSCNLKAESMSK